VIYLLMRTKFHQTHTSQHVVASTTDRDQAVKTCNDHNSLANVIHDPEGRPYPLLNVVDVPTIDELTCIHPLILP
jgi:hypothetical protein